jgi:hypothetical protein
MREAEVPPLSKAMAHYRLEVGDRATRLTRRRRGTALGAIATALVAVAAVVFLVGTGTSPTGVHRSASARTGTRPAAASGPNGAVSARPGPSLPAAASPDRSAGAPTDTQRVVYPPSGSTSPAVSGTDLTVVLSRPARGNWGDARIVTGRGSVLFFVHQSADSGGGVQITFRPVHNGTATVKVPCIGNPTGSWHGTITVSSR